MRRLPTVLMISLIAIGCAAQMRSSKGWDYLKQNNNEAAITEFKAAIQDNPLPGSYGGLYKAYLNLSDYENAWKSLEDGLKRFPEDKFLNFAAGEFHLKFTKDYNLSIFYLKKAREKLSHPLIDQSLSEAERLKAEAEMK